MSYRLLDIHEGHGTIRSMTPPASSRDTFPLRFKDPRNKDALKRMAELTGQSMTVIAERAIEHEVVLLAADLELRLQDALEVVRNYSAERDLEAYLDAAADDGASDLGPGLQVVAAQVAEPADRRAHSAPALGVLAAFARH